MSILYNIHNREDGTATVVVYAGDAPLVADNTHTNYDAIIGGVLDSEAKRRHAEQLREDERYYEAEQLEDEAATVDLTTVGLFDVTTQIAERFQNITERVSVANGRVYFDGDEIHDALTEQLLRFLDEGDEVEWIALANFYEKLATNPNDHSREQLYEWLKRFNFTITIDGDILAYKGVNDDLTSCTSGPGIVNGERKTGHLDNKPGDRVTMPRSSVQFDPAVGCSKGLHVAAYPYGSTFGSTTLAVLVNPRDVVSVPTECSWEKMRVCGYTVKEVIDREYTKPVYYDEHDEEETETCECGEEVYGSLECEECEAEREADEEREEEEERANEQFVGY